MSKKQLVIDIESEMERIGKGLMFQLDTHFKQWESGLPFKTILSKYGSVAKKLGMDISELASHLEEMKYIKISSTPNGKRYVFSSKCNWNREEMQNWLQDQEALQKIEKDLEKNHA